MYLKIKCAHNSLSESFKKNMKEYLGLDEVQSYFPIIENYFDVFNFSESHQDYVLDSRYKICNILCEPDETVAAILYDSQKNTHIQKKVFIKENPILEPTHAMQNRYQLSNRNSLLPFSSSYSERTFKKIGLKNNSTYIDSFFVFVASLLTEQNILPSFPLYYGSYCCISEEYLYNITEEYQSFKKESWFMKNNNNLFEIERSDGSDDLDIDINLEKYNSNILKTNPNNVKNNLQTVNLSDINGEIDIDDVFNTDSDETVSEFDFHSPHNETSIYAKFQDYPTQVIFMEELDGTLEDIMITDSVNISNLDQSQEKIREPLSRYMKIWRKRYKQHIRYNKWVSILFQVCFCLAFLQKHFQFTHNDLHCDNVMFVKTEEKYLYYQINDTYYKIPTFGMIIKIIDFGRAVYKINNNRYFSDVFKYESDAGGQYTYPDSNRNSNRGKNKKIHHPNFSFDLCRLSTTLIDELYPEGGSDILLYKLLKQWITDKYNKNVMRFDDFDLYKIIARRMDNAVPIQSLNNKIFDRYKHSLPPQNENIVYKLISKKL